jgi:hypothetical protein
MTPQQLQALIIAAASLASIGMQVGGIVSGWVHQLHPTLTPEEADAQAADIMADDLVREAIAKQAGGGA